MLARLAAITCAGLAVLLTVGAASAYDMHEREGGKPGNFDLYVLSLSWSPAFCDVEGDYKGKRECARGAGLGFVLHGLWPQFENGDYPTFCDRSQNYVPGDSLRIAGRVYRDRGLAIGEWRKHGECTGLEPSLYYQAEIGLMDKIKIPPTLIAPRAPLRAKASEIAAAFARANPGVMEADAVSVSCRRGEIEEVRFCLTKELRFRPCGDAVAQSCGRGEMTIPAIR